MTDWDEATPPYRVLLMVEDYVAKFLYYDRKEDSEFPVGRIEAMVISGEINAEDIVEAFRENLEASIQAQKK